jgi:signal transduction histidine kinase
MADSLLVLQLVVQVAFSLLAIRTAASWLRQPDARHGYLALALGSVALVLLVAPAMGGSGAGAQLVTDLTAILFLASGCGLLMFRDTFLPFGTRARLLILVGIAVVGVLGIAAGLPASPERPRAILQQTSEVAIVAVWAACLLEPLIRFWMESLGRPPVERHRLRALSLGYAALLSAVLIGAVTAPLNSQPVNLIVELLALAIVPLLYIAFFPPAWVRRMWRQSEEDHFRHALHDLLLYSPDRVTLAQRALVWAARLVGGDSAYVVDADGSVLAARGISSDDAEVQSDISELLPAAREGRAPRLQRSTVVVPLDLQGGRGAIVIKAGRLSPLFGDDEMSRLRQYATSISAGLDRVTLTTRVRALEQAKSEFLSVASHELRGPMTVIKGYLTMLNAGSLGALPERAQSVLPLLISKSDEVNWMLEQMVEASRLEEGRLALKKRRLDIVALTGAAIEGVKMLLSGHELTIDQPKGPVEAEVDPDRYQIVVRNLLTNAAKYSPSGTEIKVQMHRDGRVGIVTVIDQGVGISSENQAQLFTRFARIESTQHVEGTGLGLWLSREIARMHDGDLTVESAVGHGSTFVFTVPLAG